MNDKNKPFQPDCENNKERVNGSIQQNEGSKQIHFMHINSNRNDIEQHK